jgi:hypothetical protein
MGDYNNLIWLLLLLGPFLFIQRWVHQEIMAVLLLLTRRQDISLIIFSLIFFPGVFLHETSHYLIARFLGVRTGRFSVFPKLKGDGKLQLGYVETVSTDIFRDALVGAAPILSGSLIVGLIGNYPLHLSAVWDNLVQGGVNSVLLILDVFHQSDFWLWFYLAFAISSTMFPSRSDRRTWLPLIFFVSILGLLMILLGAGPWLAANLAEPVIGVMRSLIVVLSISLLIHLIVWVPMALIRRLLSRILRLEVV